MSLISKKDKEFIKFIRSKFDLPDWSLAMAIRSYLWGKEEKKGKKIKFIKGSTADLIKWGGREK